MADLHDIFVEAKRVTRLHAQGLVPNAVVTPDPQRETLHVLPGRVYVLLSNYVVLGVFAVRDRAYDEAHDLMRRLVGPWDALSDQLWSDGRRTILISAHDVR